MKHGFNGRKNMCYPPQYGCYCGLYLAEPKFSQHLEVEMQWEAAEAFYAASIGKGDE